MSTTDRWQQIEDVFHAALERAPGERDSFLVAACAADADLRARVEALLRAHSRDENPLDSPALDLAAGLPVAETNTVGAGSVIGHYQILSPLGKGGMGAVYLAMHLGTRRYVALKVIAPELMAQPEFVTRFRREAEAAGRLRHPNVVDVTDFGFTRFGATDIAYLVMEYLDGCTLADILAEEGRLPLMWAVDILEQACSAVHEAHQQGIVHRDLKPENIWIEPNRRGGYTVKVLDFGLAKLAPASPAETKHDQSGSGSSARVPSPSFKQSRPAGNDPPQPSPQTSFREAATLLLPKVSEEAATLALPPARVARGSGTQEGAAQENAASLTAPADGLTRFGSLMGTPHYMSPEQCRGQIPGPQSDIYSLGVVAYQMLSGRPPFTGEMDALIKSHLAAAPTPLREVSPKTPKKIAALIMSALAKDPAERPQSAEAFASALRARAESTGALLRRTFALYSEHFHTFLQISAISYLPWFAVLLFQLGNDLLIHTGVMPNSAATPVSHMLSGLSVLTSILCNVIISGVVVSIIIQLIVAPLRPIQSRAAFAVLRRRLRPFITTSLIAQFLFLVGLMLCFVPGIVVSVLYALYVPVVIVEDRRNWAALYRSQTLVRRTPGTVILIGLVQAAILIVVSVILGNVNLIQESPDFGARLLGRLRYLSNILLVPLFNIGIGLLYLKTRQVGGETLKETLAQFEEEDAPRRKWQMRMRERLPMLDRPGSQT
jgi:serine/threonine protein kinase